VAAAVVDDDADDVELDAVAADVDDVLEPPQALTIAATTNTQAAYAASLLERMTYLILGSPSLSAAYSPALPVGQS
jgi:hypothetical protein